MRIVLRWKLDSWISTPSDSPMRCELRIAREVWTPDPSRQVAYSAMQSRLYVCSCLVFIIGGKISFFHCTPYCRGKKNAAAPTGICREGCGGGPGVRREPEWVVWQTTRKGLLISVFSGSRERQMAFLRKRPVISSIEPSLPTR